MSYYPIFIGLKEKIALVFGGGRVAERKVETLLEYGALIHIVSKVLTDKLKALVEAGKVQHIGENFRDKHLDNAFLVFAATDDRKLNHKISKSARKRGLLINAVDQPSDCNFIVPSIVKKGDLLIAISTSGKSPALAKKTRKELEIQFGSEYEIFLILMGHLRKEVLSMGLSQEENSRIFNEIINSDILSNIAGNDFEKVESTLSRILPLNLTIKIDGLVKSPISPPLVASGS